MTKEENKKQKAPDKVKLFEDRNGADRELSKMAATVEAFNSLSEFLTGIDVNMPTDVKTALLSQGMNSDKLKEFVSEQFKEYPDRIANPARMKLLEDIEEWPDAPSRGLISFEYVKFDKGRAIPFENAEQSIRERYTYYLTDPEEIEVFQRLNNWVAEGNELWQRLKPYQSNRIGNLAELILLTKGGGIALTNTIIYKKH